MSDSNHIEIRPLTTISEFQAAEALQRLIWPGSETSVVPLHLLITVAQNGGLVLGAWDDEKLVGYLFGFLGADDADPERVAMARLKHCSHQMGVHPDYRNQHLGYRLKTTQRDFVLAQGVRMATWTYDPLETRNAHLNLHLLSGVVRRYKREQYGAMDDELNAGLPSDRFFVEWWLSSNRVKERIEGTRRPVTLEQYLSAELPILNAPSRDSTGLLVPSDSPVIAQEGLLLLVCVPTAFQDLKQADAQLALEWRLHTRAIFESAFAAGYLVTDFVREATTAPDTGYYILSLGEAMFKYDDTFSRN